jgi:hypothetical protein
MAQTLQAGSVAIKIIGLANEIQGAIKRTQAALHFSRAALFNCHPQMSFIPCFLTVNDRNLRQKTQGKNVTDSPK